MSDGYSIDQQKLIISALLSDKELFARCQNIIVPEYWNKQFVKSVKFILKFSQDYKSVPTPEQILGETGVKYELIEVSKEHQQYFLDEVEKFCRHSALTHAILTGADMLEKGEYGNIEKLVKDAL